MLDAFSRSAIVAMTVLCLIGAVALTPMRARSSNDPSSIDPSWRHRVPPAPLGTAVVADIVIRRDPFIRDAARPATNAGTASAAAPASTATAAQTASGALSVLPGGALRPLPGNLTDSTIPAIPGDASAVALSPRVTAIVTGAHPYAMFDTAGSHEIKGIGDRLNGTPITAIDIDGVTLRSGARLTVTPRELPQ